MRLTQIFAVFILVLLFSFCKKAETSVPYSPVTPVETPQPSASFSASKYFPKTGESVKFTNTSKDAETYEWDFGDGEKSTEGSPEHLFKEKGNYNVKLTTRNGEKTAVTDTIIHYGFKASVNFKFYVLKWLYSSSSEAELFKFSIQLFKASSPTVGIYVGSNTVQHNGGDGAINAVLPVENESDEYFIKINIYNSTMCGLTQPTPVAEYFDPYQSITFPFLNLSSINQSYAFRRFIINYEFSETHFE